MKKILYLFTGLFLGVLITSYFFLEYFSSDEIISSKTVRTLKAEKIIVEYVAYPCGNDCSRLTEIYQDGNGKEVLAKKGLFINYSEGIQNPENTQLAVSGNRFILTAYRKIEMKVNKHHQDLQHFNNHISVIGWEVITPYSIWGKGNPPEQIKKNTPIKQSSQT